MRVNRTRAVLWPSKAAFFFVVLWTAQMRTVRGGVAGLSKLFMERFGQSLATDEVDHLCIDMNYIVYSAIPAAASYQEAVFRTTSKIDALLQKIRVRKSVVLAFDGPAPLAKLRTQRDRRMGSPAENPSVLLTPGTTFMDYVGDAMTLMCVQRAHMPQWENVTFFVSTSESPGEGELKMVDWIRTFVVKTETDTVVLYGADSDIILQALATDTVRHLEVVSQVRERSKVELYSFTRKAILSELGKEVQTDPQSMAMDLILLSILNGNDYVPKLRGSSFGTIFKAYNDAMSKFDPPNRRLLDAETNSFHWPALRELLVHINTLTPSTETRRTGPPTLMSFLQIALDKKMMPARTCEWTDLIQIHGSTPLYQMTLSIASENFTSNWHSSKREAQNEVAEQALAMHAPSLIEKYYECCENYDIVTKVFPRGYPPWEEDEPAKLHCYLQGLLWTIQMYTDGYCPDVTYVYGWNYGPSAESLLEYIDFGSTPEQWSLALRDIVISIDNTSKPTTVAEQGVKLNALVDLTTLGPPEEVFVESAPVLNSTLAFAKATVSARIRSLRRIIRTPFSTQPHMSAEATLLCILPKLSELQPTAIPAHLWQAWCKAQSALYPDGDCREEMPLDTVYKPLLPVLSYTRIIQTIMGVAIEESLWNSSIKSHTNFPMKSNPLSVVMKGTTDIEDHAQVTLRDPVNMARGKAWTLSAMEDHRWFVITRKPNVLLQYYNPKTQGNPFKNLPKRYFDDLKRFASTFGISSRKLLGILVLQAQATASPVRRKFSTTQSQPQSSTPIRKNVQKESARAVENAERRVRKHKPYARSKSGETHAWTTSAPSSEVAMKPTMRFGIPDRPPGMVRSGPAMSLLNQHRSLPRPPPYAPLPHYPQRPQLNIFRIVKTR